MNVNITPKSVFHTFLLSITLPAGLLAILLIGCSPQQSERLHPVLVDVKILEVRPENHKEVGEWHAHADNSLIERQDTKERLVIAGIYGKEGDVFKMRFFNGIPLR